MLSGYIAGAIMKQEVILVLTVARPMSGPSRLIGREKLLPRLNA